MATMGLEQSLRMGLTCKRKFRWSLHITDAIGEDEISANVLPPLKSARPNLQFKETMVYHLSEDMYYPGKPDWKPITITVYDVKRPTHPIFDWIMMYYMPDRGCLVEPNRPIRSKFIKNNAILRMYDGCGQLIESWIYEDCWPQSVDFQTLDMADSNVMLVDIVLRYARAWVEPVLGSGCPVYQHC